MNRIPFMSMRSRWGEVAYNLRSGLDHLVWQLVLANGETPDTRPSSRFFKKRAAIGNRPGGSCGA